MNDLNYTALWGFLAVVCLFLIGGLVGISRDQESGKKDYGQRQTDISSGVFWMFIGFIIFGSLTALTWGN